MYIKLSSATMLTALILVLSVIPSSGGQPIDVSYSQVPESRQGEGMVTHQVDFDHVGAFGPAVDSQGNVLVAGGVSSPGAQNEIYVSKFSSVGSWIWTIFIPGAAQDFVQGIGIAPDDNFYITGLTVSEDYFTSSNAFSKEIQGDEDIFITQIKPNGELGWSTFIGGSQCEPFIQAEHADNFGFDSQGNVFVVGVTTCTDFPVTEDAFDKTYNGGEDAVLFKFSSQGELLYSTYIGGSDGDHVRNLALTVDNLDNVYIGGGTFSNDLPVINSPLNSSYMGGPRDAWLAKFTQSETSVDLDFVTYWGDTGIDDIMSLASDEQNNIILAGRTTSSNFPVKNAYQPKLIARGFASAWDGFITKLSPNGSIVFSTYFGGFEWDDILDVETDGDNNIVFVGHSLSSTIHFKNAFDDQNTGIGTGTSDEHFVAKFHPNGSLYFSSFIGGSGEEIERSVTVGVDKLTNDIYIAGQTSSIDFIPVPGGQDTFPFVFDTSEDERGYLIKISEDAEVQWSTLTLVPKDRDADYDGDGLDNFDEFKENTNPNDPDTDNDGMNDGWEVEHRLLPNVNDSALDSDLDGVLNFDEFLQGSHPFNPDTDNDTMTDLFEFTYGLDMVSNDTELDHDGDGLINLYEFQAMTDPFVNDTDGDGMSDGFEVLYNLDPLDSIDADGDLDDDGLSNLDEFRLNTNPLVLDTDGDGMGDGDEFEGGYDPANPFSNPRYRLLSIAGSVVIVTIMGLIILRIILLVRRADNKAKELGFSNIAAKRRAQRRGFRSFVEVLDAESKGFFEKEIMQIFNVAGLKSVESYIEDWQVDLFDTDQILSDAQIKQTFSILSTAENPENLVRSVNLANVKVRQIESFISNLENFQSLKYAIENYKSGNMNQYLPGIDVAELDKLAEQSKLHLAELAVYRNELQQLIEKRREWFEPWDRLLTFLQLTEDSAHIPIDEIANVIGLETSHTIELLSLLTIENSLLGDLDESKKSFVKGVNVSKYIDYIRSRVFGGD